MPKVSEEYILNAPPQMVHRSTMEKWIKFGRVIAKIRYDTLNDNL